MTILPPPPLELVVDDEEVEVLAVVEAVVEGVVDGVVVDGVVVLAVVEGVVVLAVDDDAVEAVLLVETVLPQAEFTNQPCVTQTLLQKTE